MATTAAQDLVIDAGTRGDRRRQWWCGCSLLLGAVTLAAAEIVHPDVVRDGAPALALSFSTSPQLWTVWSVLLMGTALLQLPGVLAWRNRVTTGRGAALVRAGTAITAAALVALFAFGQSHAQGVAFAGPPPVDSAVLDAFSRADGSAPVGITVVLALFGFHLGWPLVLLGLARAGAVPVPLALIGTAASVGAFLVGPLGRTTEAAAFVVLAATLVSISLPLLRSREL